ncbi:hypothetical protein C9374_012268 [Naegleria lovaniensis]|uniref:TOG domain-containing protein n=1 Tax=Naegleria lovaniensis TaxID=51637 RepID=A0AA88KDV8_NAELO|nr:uncharacterized protein C9374_012268 [Naegleria lovaniensis]KAG2373279.1 hypothetical protein C9374_012268 [Naegleria lovaniensis]
MTLHDEAAEPEGVVEPQLPSSHDLFQKMLEEELRKEEERLKNNELQGGVRVPKTKTNSSNMNFDEQPIKPIPQNSNGQSTALHSRKMKQQDPSSKVEEIQTTTTSSSAEISSSTDKVQQLLPENDMTERVESSCADGLNQNETPRSFETERFETKNDDFEIHIRIPAARKRGVADPSSTTTSNNNSEEQPLSLPTPVMTDVPNSVTSPFEEATPPSSNLLFENMLRKQLLEENVNNSSSNDDNPAWKKKVDELEQLCTKFKQVDSTDSVFQASENELIQALNNRHPSVLEKAVETLYHFVNHYKNAPSTAEKFIPILIEKGLPSKPSVQSKSIEIILLYIEVSDPTCIISILKGHFSNKKPKLRAQCIGIVQTAVHDFGFPTIPPKIILQSLPSILDDASVREEAHKLAMETFRWLGFEAVEAHLTSVKPNKMKALKEEFDLIKDKSPAAVTRFCRSTLNAASSKTSTLSTTITSSLLKDIEPPTKEKETVDINEKLRKDWYNDAENEKWSIRRNAFEELKKIVESFHIKKGCDCSNVFSAINVVIQREKNVTVVKESIDCLNAFSKAMKSDFIITAKSLYERLLTKLKEKKLADPTIECLVSFDTFTFPFTDMLETIFSAMNNKTASTSEKLQIFVLIERCLLNKKKKDLEKALKSLTNHLLSFTDDASSEVRDTCCKIIARLIWVVGESGQTSVFMKLESHVKEKIVQYLESYGTPPIDSDFSKKLSQSIEHKKVASSAVQKPSSAGSVSRPPSRTMETKPSSSSTKRSKVPTSKSLSLNKQSNNSGSNSAPAITLSASDVLEECKILFGEACIEKLTNSNWSDRIAALCNIESVINSLEKSTLEAKQDHIIGLFQYKPGLKESNAKVLEKIFDMIECILNKTDGKSGELNALPTITWMVDKLITPKVDVQAKKGLKAFCESINPQYLFIKICENLDDKPPKLIGSILEWLSEVITEFSIACFSTPELIDFAKKYLGNSNPIIKKGCIKMIVAMRSYMGEGLLNFFSDTKPALLDMVKKEFQKVDGPPPEPTRKVKGQERIQLSMSAYENSLPRFDIMPKIAPKIYHSLDDKNWIIRVEALQTIEKIITDDAHKRIQPNILDLIHALRQRLEDANIKVVTTTLTLLDVIAEAVGSDMEKFLKILLPSIVSKSMHNNKAVRSAALESLDKYISVFPFESMLKFFPKAITSEKGNPEGKKEVLEFIYNHLATMKTKNIDIFSPLVKPLLEYLQASRPDTRKLAEAILSEILQHGGYDYVSKQVRELKPAFQKSLAPLLQKHAPLPTDSDSSQPQLLTQSVNLSSTPATLQKPERKMTLRDVSRSLNVESRQTTAATTGSHPPSSAAVSTSNTFNPGYIMSNNDPESEFSKQPKTVKKRANISKTLASSPNRSPSPPHVMQSKTVTVQPLKPFLPIIPRLQLGTTAQSPSVVDEYKLDLEKIEEQTVTPHMSSSEVTIPELPQHQPHNTSLTGNSTPRMPERSPVKETIRKEQIHSTLSVGELVDTINTSEHGSEVAINALKTLVMKFKDESCRPAILSYLKELVECLTENTQYSFEKASAGIVSTRICKYLLSTLMSLFNDRQMAAFVPQETLQRTIDQLLSRLLDERLPSLENGQDLLKGLNSLMLKVLENSNRTFSYTSLIHLLEYSYANPALKKYSELVVKCLIKLTKALAATISRVDVDILLMDLHSFLTHNPPTLFKDRNDLPLRTVKTILNELVKVKGESIRSCLNLIPTHKNPLIISYIELMLTSSGNQQVQVGSVGPTMTTNGNGNASSNAVATSIAVTSNNLNIQANGENTSTSNTIVTTTGQPSTLQQTQPQQAKPTRPSPPKSANGINEKAIQDELTEIFNLISNKDSTHSGLYKLYEFKKTHPSVSINTHLSKCSEPFQQYIHRQLAKIAQYEASKQDATSRSVSTTTLQKSQPAASSVSPTRKTPTITSVDDIRRQLKLVQQESKLKNARSLTVSDLKKRIQNIEEKLSADSDE